MIPLYDDIPSRRLPLITGLLVLLNLLVGVFTLTDLEAWLPVLGLVPAELLSGDPSALLTLGTSMFVHGDVLHLVGNLWFLYLFGDNVEDRLGHLAYAVLYLAAGLAGSALHVLGNADSWVPTIGASGAISGLIGAYVVWFPGARITTLVLAGFWMRTLQISAWIYIVFWFATNLAGLWLGGGSTAWGAHIGGFLVGVAVGVLGLAPRR